MRAFISVCALAAVEADYINLLVGDWDYQDGGDWDYQDGGDSWTDATCKGENQSPIDINCGTADCEEDDYALSIKLEQYSKANKAAMKWLGVEGEEKALDPAVNMQISFPVSATQDGTNGFTPAVLDDKKTETEQERLHKINKEWFDEGNCDDECKNAVS